MNKILVVAPHPDDEVLGCGGTIAKYTEQGDEVFLCIVTEPYQPEWSEAYIQNKEKEIKKSNEILGIKKTYFLGLPTVKLDTLPQKDLNNKIHALIRETQPDIVLAPFGGDLNMDHRLVFEACLVAARPALNTTIKQFLAYETLSETEWGVKSFVPQAYVDITQTIDTKIQAMEAYESELKKSPHPRSVEVIKAQALKRGSEVLINYAEAFMVIRKIIS